MERRISKLFVWARHVLEPVLEPPVRHCITHYVAGDGQQYIFSYRSNQMREALRQPGLMVIETRQEFSWADAVIVAEMMHEQGAVETD